MPALAAGDVLLWQVVSQLGDQSAINALHLSVVSVGALPATDADAAQDLDTILAPDLKALMSNQATYRGSGIRILLQPVTLPFAVYTANSGAGTSINDPMPGQVSGIITWQTALVGRGYRGRMYVPFPSVAFATASGTPSAAYVTALNNLAVAITGAITVGGGGRTAVVALSLYHRVARNTTTILTARANDSWATQRRRGNYGRPNVPPW